ncbi:LysM domain-containing protein [Parageobacillus sp. G301]
MGNRHSKYFPWQGATTYIVRPGDTLWKISVRYQVGLSEIIEEKP